MQKAGPQQTTWPDASTFRSWHAGSAALAAVVLFSCALTLAASTGTASEESRSLREETARHFLHSRALEHQLELASGDAFYLVVDPGAREMTLRLGAVTLQRLDLHAVSVAEARVAFIHRSAPAAWQGVVWSEAS